ncbi:MAG: cobalt-zinc-cadmium efflux system membrane fusion protein, partial [Sphingobacteriales bacterium]
DIGYIEILPVTKIHPKSQIVVSGAFYLLAEMKKGEGGHGHHH